MTEERQFTVEDANRLLPELATSLQAIREAHAAILAGAEPFRRHARDNGGGEQREEYWVAMATMRAELERIIELGIVLRDAGTGLIDFPSQRDGQEIFLCWRLGEDSVGFWHGPESGFAGRRPL